MDKIPIGQIKDIIGDFKEITLLENQGCTSKVRKIISETKKFIIKSSYNERYREWLKNEANVLKQLSERKFHLVPKYIGFIDEDDASHIIMSYEEGEPLTLALDKATSIQEKKSLIKSFGQLIQQLHNSRILFDENIQNETWLECQLIMAEKYFYEGGTDGSLELLNKIKANKPKPIEQTVIHGDCTTDNVLVMNGKVKLFIDVAGMTIGDPRYDLALAIRKFNMNQQLIDAFYEGYTKYTISEEEFEYFNNGLYEFF